jgi:predicted RNase H-like nuclease (RuvC/YqgF family)
VCNQENTTETRREVEKLKTLNRWLKNKIDFTKSEISQLDKRRNRFVATKIKAPWHRPSLLLAGEKANCRHHEALAAE